MRLISDWLDRRQELWKYVSQITDCNVILVKDEVMFEGSSIDPHDQPELLRQHLGM